MKSISTPASARKPSLIRQSLAWFNWHIALRNIFITVCGSSSLVFVAFALSAGIAAEHMARFTAVAGFGCLFQILILPALEFIKDRKKFTLWICTIEAMIFIAIVVSAFFPSVLLRENMLLAGIFLATSMMNMTQPIRDDWLAATIPSGLRSRFIGNRDLLSCLAMAAATLAAGIGGDLVGSRNTLGLGAILAAAAIFGTISVSALARVHMPASASFSVIRFSAVREILSHLPFRRYIAAAFTYNVPFFLAIPYYQVLNQKALNMNLHTIGLMSLSYMIIRAIASRIFGPSVGLIGARRILLMVGPAYAAFFVMLTFTKPYRVWPVILGWAVISIIDACESIAMQINLFGAVPENGSRPAFFAVCNLISLSSMATGAAVSEVIVSMLRDVSIAWGPFELHQYQCLYFICALLMIPCTFGALFLCPRKNEELSGIKSQKFAQKT